MRKHSRIAAALLAAVMLLTGSALAASGQGPSIETTASGASVTLQGSSTNQLTVTYTSSAIQQGGQYMIWVVQDSGGTYTPTASTVLYLNQVTATSSGKVSFENVYPSKMRDSAVFISGTGLSQWVQLAQISAGGAQGDVDCSGSIDVYDVILVARYNAGKTVPDSFDEDAADVNGDGKVNAKDLTLILQYVAKEITAFPNT